MVSPEKSAALAARAQPARASGQRHRARRHRCHRERTRPRPERTAASTSRSISPAISGRPSPRRSSHGAERGRGRVRPLRLHVQDIRNTTSYYFEAGDHKSETYTITVVHEPILTDVRVTLTPPAYTGEAPTTLTENAGNVQALEGTKVQVQARSNNPLRGAWVQFDDKAEAAGRRTRAAISRSISPRSPTDTTRCCSRIRSASRRATRSRTSIEVFQDHAPTVDVLEPGKDTDDAAHAGDRPRASSPADDYGVARASLHYRKNGERRLHGDSRSPLGEQKSKQGDGSRVSLGTLAARRSSPATRSSTSSKSPTTTSSPDRASRAARRTASPCPPSAELYDTAREEEQHRDETHEDRHRGQPRSLSEQLEKLSREYVEDREDGLVAEEGIRPRGGDAEGGAAEDRARSRSRSTRRCRSCPTTR